MAWWAMCSFSDPHKRSIALSFTQYFSKRTQSFFSSSTAPQASWLGGDIDRSYRRGSSGSIGQAIEHRSKGNRDVDLVQMLCFGRGRGEGWLAPLGRQVVVGAVLASDQRARSLFGGAINLPTAKIWLVGRRELDGLHKQHPTITAQTT